MPNEYKQFKVEQWKQIAEDIGLKIVSKTKGLSINEFRIKSEKPLVKDKDMLLCFCDGWWTSNFGGYVIYHSDTSASVTLYVD